MPNLYFAYGSNLNEADRRERCVPDPIPMVVGTAVLPDYALQFSAYSYTRDGGVLDIVHKVGSTVEGVVYQVIDGGFEVLDRKEGAPKKYEQIKVMITLTAGIREGEAIEAISYWIPESKKQTFVLPNPTYVDIVKSGLEAFGLDTIALLNAAKCD